MLPARVRVPGPILIGAVVALNPVAPPLRMSVAPVPTLKVAAVVAPVSVVLLKRSL